MTSLPFLLFCAVVVRSATSQYSSKNVWDIITFVNGNWTNRAQVEAGSKDHDLFESRIIPVYIPALHTETILFEEDVINGELVSLYLLGVTQDDVNENIVHMIHYTFNVTKKYQPGEFQVDELYNLTTAELHSQTDCVDSFVRLGEGVFAGTCLICDQVIDKHHPAFGLTLTCDAYALTAPLSAPVRATTTPYVFLRNGQRYPLVNPPKDYVSPCDR